MSETTKDTDLKYEIGHISASNKMFNTVTVKCEEFLQLIPGLSRGFVEFF